MDFIQQGGHEYTPIPAFTKRWGHEVITMTARVPLMIVLFYLFVQSGSAYADAFAVANTCGSLVGKASACGIDTQKLAQVCGSRIDSLTAYGSSERAAAIKQFMLSSQMSARYQQGGGNESCSEIQSAIDRSTDTGTTKAEKRMPSKAIRLGLFKRKLATSKNDGNKVYFLNAEIYLMPKPQQSGFFSSAPKPVEVPIYELGADVVKLIEATTFQQLDEDDSYWKFIAGLKSLANKKTKNGEIANVLFKSYNIRSCDIKTKQCEDEY